MRTKDVWKTIKYLIGPILGTLFLLWYIRAAGADVVYSDYIRLVDAYLPDVGDVRKLLVPDILTRIPLTFLERFINVKTFGYSVNIERLLSVGGITLMALVVSVYAKRYEISVWWQIPIYVVLFSLIKWEILLNGTAWAHVVSFGLFFVNYALADLMWRGESDPKQELLLCLMPLFWLLIAGEYLISYAVTMILLSIFGILTGGVNSWAVKRGRTLFQLIFLSAVLALGLYMLSRHFAVWEHSGASDTGLLQLLKENPVFLLRFFLKSFAGAVIGQETIANFFGNGAALSDTMILGVGLLVLLLYALAFFLYLRAELFEVSIFPLLLLVSGFGNHMLVTIGRCIFLKEGYALSSRYAGQFMIGIIGILLIFSMYAKQKRPMKHMSSAFKTFLKAVTAVAAVFILAGNCYTSYQEIRKAPYREANYEHMAEVILDYESYSEEALAKELEWTKAPETLYNALEILKDNHLNVFRVPGVH